jgi:hypothetical protein
MCNASPIQIFVLNAINSYSVTEINNFIKLHGFELNCLIKYGLRAEKLNEIDIELLKRQVNEEQISETALIGAGMHQSKVYEIFGKLEIVNTNDKNKLRIIETVRGNEEIENAKLNGKHLIFRDVVPYRKLTGKYCLVKNKKTGDIKRLFDYRDSEYYSKEYEIITDWTYEYYENNFPDKAAYIIPSDIKEFEIVYVKDLIENFDEYIGGQGGSNRLTGWNAIWQHNNLEILYNRERDCKIYLG